jgi:hypothetical protein
MDRLPAGVGDAPGDPSDADVLKVEVRRIIVHHRAAVIDYHDVGIALVGVYGYDAPCRMRTVVAGLEVPAPNYAGAVKRMDSGVVIPVAM